MIWWAFILFLYLLGISLPFHLVYIAVFGVAFPYSGSLWFLFTGLLLGRTERAARAADKDAPKSLRKHP